MDKIDTTVLNSSESVLLAEKINAIIDHLGLAAKEVAPEEAAPTPTV